MAVSLVKKMLSAIAIGSICLAAPAAGAYPIRTPEGNMPMVHWAVVKSTAGDMQRMGEIAAQTVGPEAAGEAGTYALYGGVDAADHDVLRLLEIYESYEAYRIHSTSEAFQAYRAARLPILRDLKILEANGIALEQKGNGIGTVVYMHRYEIAPEGLATYQRLAAEEAARAVENDPGVMGMFVTAEHERPNIIHTMEIYRDKEAYQDYIASAAYQKLQQQIRPFIIKAREIENLPTQIKLAHKGK